MNGGTPFEGLKLYEAPAGPPEVVKLTCLGEPLNNDVETDAVKVPPCNAVPLLGLTLNEKSWGG